MSLDSRQWLVAAALAVTAGIASWTASAHVVAATGHENASGGFDDIWFDADTASTLSRLTVGGHEQDYTIRHPLVPLLLRLPARVAMRSVPGADGATVLRAGLAVSAGLWVALLFAVLRRVAARPLDAVVLTLVGMTSAASMFWFVAPETFAVGALTVLPALLLCAGRDAARRGEGWTTAAAALAASVTVTNAMFGAIAAFVRHPPRRAAQITANAIVVVLALWGLQRFVYPSSTFPYGYDESYRPFIFSADMRTPAAPLAVMLVGTVVMPEVTTIDRLTQDGYRVLSIQRSWPGSGSVAGAVATAAWAGMLVLGLAGMQRPDTPPALRRFLLSALAGQAGLHVVFGEETFLFAMHFLPLLLALGALGTLTRARRAALILAAIVLVCGTLNNVEQFSRSLQLASAISSGVPHGE